VQQIQGKLSLLSRHPSDRPDPRRLEQRYADFLRAGCLVVDDSQARS
jgi:hypothetical protein